MADTYQTIKCPACGKAMKKIFIPEYGINIDICDQGCGGLYFDAKELQMVETGSDKGVNEISSYIEGKTFPPVDQGATRICPNCATKMVKTKINGLNVQIDTCYNCGGVFLDHGELDLIRAGIKNCSQPSIRKQNYRQADANSLSNFYREAQIEEAEFDWQRNHFGRRGFDIFDMFYHLFW